MNSATAKQNQTVAEAGTPSPRQLASGLSCAASGDASSAQELKQQIDLYLSEDLGRVNQILRSQLRSNSALVSEMVDHVSRFQGKQLRPVLLMLMHRMSADQSRQTGEAGRGTAADADPADSGSMVQTASMLAAAVEMIHLATLVHDDVIDEAKTRRHVATVHRRWDTEASVLLGDFLFSRAFHLSATTGDAGSCALIGKATDRTCEGELNQMAARLEQSESELDYFRIIRGKTGQLFALSCRLGARSALASVRQLASATRFGQRLGLAFQIADDILDLTESTERTGKDAANDIQNGRRTLPILRALRAATIKERRTMNRLLGESECEAFEEIKAMPCVVSGIRSAAQSAQQLVDRARRDLMSFPDNRERRFLHSIAEFAVQRQS